MKKVEFPTFLNEQPTIIFGRTGRELLFLACGVSLSYSAWQNLGGLRSIPAGIVLSVCLALIPFLCSAGIAFFSVSSRPLEEWLFILLLYMFNPKLYLYASRQRTGTTNSEMNEQRQGQQPLREEDIDE